MNNSLERLLEGIAIALRRDVIPRLDDEYATGQALAVIDLINNMKSRVDWAVPPLLARATSQRALIAKLDSLLDDYPGRPTAGADFDTMPFDGSGLQAVCEHMDSFIGATIRWLGMRAAESNETLQAAHAAIDGYVRAELRRDMALTPRPLFAGIARGHDTPASLENPCSHPKMT
jgi:hypothetical protein